MNFDHADGQKIAKRLSKSITKETATVRNTLVNYNSVLCTIGDQTCSLQDVLCPDSEFREPSDLAVTWGKKKELIQAYLLLKRSKEELALLEKERLNTVDYWFKLQSAINKHLLSLKLCDKYSVGVIALLKTRLSIA